MPRMREVAWSFAGLGRLQHMNGSRCWARAPWDRGRLMLLPAAPAGAGICPDEARERQQVELEEAGQPGRRLVGIDLGIASRHSVRVLEADGRVVCRSSCVPTVESLARLEQAALAGAPE